MHTPPDPRTARVVAFFETLRPESLLNLELIYCEQARFKDPFNDVIGLDRIHRVFAHMFDTLDAPRFEVLHTMTQHDRAWITWHFIIQRKGDLLCIHGATQLQFAPDGRVLTHRDYWDPAEELYARLPVLGPLVRWLTKRLSATA